MKNPSTDSLTTVADAAASELVARHGRARWVCQNFGSAATTTAVMDTMLTATFTPDAVAIPGI